MDHRPNRHGRHPSLHNLRGLKASIFTDVVQTVVIVPLLAAVVVAGFLTLGGVQPIVEGLADRAPQLMEWGYLPGLAGALTFIVAILAANLFHQGYWQRIYPVRSPGSLRNGFPELGSSGDPHRVRGGPLRAGGGRLG